MSIPNIPVLTWTQIGGIWIAWINDTEVYTIKPVQFVDRGGSTPEWELRIEHVATGTYELVGVYGKPDEAFSGARTHVGDDD